MNDQRVQQEQANKKPEEIQSIVLGIILDTPNYFGFGK